MSGDDSDSPLDAPKVIVFMSSLLSLLSVCKEPGCGSCVDRENMKVVTKGAMVRVHMLCNNNHSTSWDSSPVIGSGRSSVAVINILIGSYCLLTGLHIKQVMTAIIMSNPTDLRVELSSGLGYDDTNK